jgi:hypothetical protein
MRHQSTRPRRAAVALLAALALAGASCSRDEGETETGVDTTVAGGDTTAPEDVSRLDAAGFGDLENVCQDGDATGATDTGVTDDSIQLGTITDKGFQARPGLNEEMYDTAVAFANWCNEHGGINGREIVVADRDAALTDFNARIIDACSQDFALVGGGAVLDEADNGGRVACGLPNISGYVVSEIARSADLQVQPVPNPTGRLSFGVYQVIADQSPELIDRYGVITSSFGSVVNVRDDTVAAAEDLGFSTVYSEEYNSAGESNWRPFVDAMQAADVQVMDFVGEPTFFGQLLESMDQAGYRPAVMILNANFYDRTFAENAGTFAENVHVRLQYTPLELADENPATADYLELMERYNPDGKVALLGMQSLSAFLLFAQSAAACGADLTRACLLEEAGSVTEWTAGGLHAPQDPASNTPSPCFVTLDVSAEGFAVNEELTEPTDGIFNCEDDNVVDVPVG